MAGFTERINSSAFLLSSAENYTKKLNLWVLARPSIKLTYFLLLYLV
jgi:hypothetical protein